MKLRTAMYLALVMPALVFSTGYAENRPEGHTIKDYATVHYAQLQDDLHKGEGPTLTSLFNMLQTPAKEKEETIKRLLALLVAYPTVSEFTDRVPDFTHNDQAPVVPAAPAVNVLDLEKLFVHMKYKTPLHLSMTNGDEVDGIFSSFNQSQEIIWVKTAAPSGGFIKKVYHLRQMKNAFLQLPPSAL